MQAAGKAINSPLLEASMDGAQGVLLSIAGGSDLGLFEINEAASLVQEAAHPEANIIFGTVIDDSLGDEVRVTVIAAGLRGRHADAQEAGADRVRVAVGRAVHGTRRVRVPPRRTGGAHRAPGGHPAAGCAVQPAPAAHARGGAPGGVRVRPAGDDARAARRHPAAGPARRARRPRRRGLLHQRRVVELVLERALVAAEGRRPYDPDDDVDVPSFMKR